MIGPRTSRTFRSLAAMVLGLVLVLALPHPSSGQPPWADTAPRAELVRVVGRVEILRKGQTQWVPAVIGAHLVEGDDIRAFSGAQAELRLPDTSTVVLAENSRLLLTKLDFDRQNQSRTVLLHLAVGKLRAAIAQASIALVRVRQSNFAISTPTAVAAARGTTVWVITDGSRSLFAVEPERGTLQQSRVDCIPLRGVPAGTPLTGVAVFGGSASMDCGPVTPIPALTLSNPDTANSPILLGAPVTVPPRALEAATAPLTALTTPTTAPVSFNTNGGLGRTGPPSTFGRDVQENQVQSQNQQNNSQGMSAGQNQGN
jgi:FecR protein